MNKKFIWLDDETHREYQNTYYTTFCDKQGFSFAMAEFKKSHKFENKIKSAHFNIFADAKYTLYINGEVAGTGPACPGGDWAIKTPMPQQYYDRYAFENLDKEMDIYVQVCLNPTDMCDVSCGKGGLWAEYEVVFENDEKCNFIADQSWLCRRDTRFTDINTVDLSATPEEWENAAFTEPVWNLKPSPLMPLEEVKVLPVEKDKDRAVFDKIYAGYLCIRTEGKGEMVVSVGEIPEKRHSHYTVKGAGEIRIPVLESVGEVDVKLSGDIIFKDVFVMASHYPVISGGSFRCSDNKLNKIYQLGRHTTDICRQKIELDSPVHKENLGCPGDYMIESLISYYAFGDYTLSGFDITRIAEYLRVTDGKMFHTSYSLMWIYMLYDYVMFSGDIGKLTETKDVLESLLCRFAGYEKNGILENSPDYMFIDWVMIGEYNLHHPPKALGQAALTAFYYHALEVSAKIYELMRENEKKKELLEKADVVKKAFNKAFYDEEKGLYISGLSTPGIPGKWQPENPGKVFYTRHTNILAVCYGLCDNGAEIMEKVITDKSMPPIQPYFMHFELEALYRCGLFDKYGVSEMHRWDKLVDECDKGMKEGWGDGCGEYNYDYSHAWGSTPTYQLPSKISGLEILKPGFEEISLNPCLFGLESAEIVIPTPKGKIEIKLGEKTEIKIPQGIKRKDAVRRLFYMCESVLSSER